MKDMFNNGIREKEISISIYCDERKIDSCQHACNENWIYMSMLLIPESKKIEVLTMLKQHRNDENYYHELKFRKIKAPGCNSPATRVAKLWLQEIAYDVGRKFYFKILGIKKDNLLFELFRSDDISKGVGENIYNRFFRTTFLSALNLFFPGKEYAKISISELFHDRHGGLESHQYFPWHLCYKVSDDRINFENNKICFIDSDHRIETEYKDESQFIQLADILVGSISHCLDLPTERNEGKNETARIILPLLKDILNEVYSEKSCFDYFRKYDVSFYPSKKLALEGFSDSIYRAQSQFFKNRRILLEERLSGQQSFAFEWF